VQEGHAAEESSMTTAAARRQFDRQTTSAYERLEERTLSREQTAAAEAFFDLVRQGRPPTEIAAELVRIHAPYTSVPYHQRLDDGVVRFVNNDHCLLSARASLRLTNRMPVELRYLPLAQTAWYIPTGLDPWNQLIGRAPGHYSRMYEIAVGEAPPPPQIHWPDQEPLVEPGSFKERLDQWLTLVQRGEVLQQYRVFLGLLADEAHRRELLAELVFAGLIDVQDRMLFNRSYTTGHKSYRARATVELGDAIGWEHAHSVVYAGVPDIAVGPRWYSTYEMACNVCQAEFEGRDHELTSKEGVPSAGECEQTREAVLHSYEPVWQNEITTLLRNGRSPRRILDLIQTASAEVIIWTTDSKAFSMPQHSFEYCNTLRWFFDTFDHRHQLKLLYVAAAFVNAAAHHQVNTGQGPLAFGPAASASTLSQGQLLDEIEQAVLDLQSDESVALTAAYLEQAFDRRPLARTLAIASSKIGNDPHNQELGLCLVEDYEHSTAPGRDRLLLAAARHTAGHRKYGDPLELYHRLIGQATRN
jgi:hypothetical protein